VNRAHYALPHDSPDNGIGPDKSAWVHSEVVPGWSANRKLPEQKFQLDDKTNGICMQSYYGGRAEIRIRHTPVPILYTDFLSQYPTVNTLLGLWRLLHYEGWATLLC
jgi:hypothetical protein